MKRPNLIFICLLMLIVMPVTARNATVIKVLAIGNSFSEDAIENNLHELFQAAGRQSIIANMYIGGCTLERHWKNAKGDIADYRYRKVDVNGDRHQIDRMTLKKALTDEKWDYVSLQQASGVSGKYATYTPYMADLIKYVHSYAPQAKIIWHQTWAYAQNSDHKEFPNYGRSQKAMYDSIMSASTRVLKDYQIRTVIPCGTAIQNARTSFLGDHMNRDGYHLNLIYGRYTAACTWFEALSGKNVIGNSYAPKDLSADVVRVAQESAHAAVQSPFSVTPIR